VPTDSEWIILTDYLGGLPVAGGKMKSIGTIQAGTGLWEEPNTNATNESGFSGLPGGDRTDSDFRYIGEIGGWWSNTEDGSFGGGLYRDLGHDDGNCFKSSTDKRNGQSLRCIKN
jgi:uncharacterized protein (TIGR02145 family)